MNGFEPRFIELAAQINNQMPTFTVSRVADALNDRQKSLKGSKILGLGVAYKPDVNDVRESPALEVLHKLLKRGAHLFYSDPHISTIELGTHRLHSVIVTPAFLQSTDCVVVLTNHSLFDYRMIATYSPLVVDCRNALKDFPEPHILRL
jgi:UDP-N-acetyl-D-glucosamine dehydrogenase